MELRQLRNAVSNIQCTKYTIQCGHALATVRPQRYITCENTACTYRRSHSTRLWICIFCTIINVINGVSQLPALLYDLPFMNDTNIQPLRKGAAYIPFRSAAAHPHHFRSKAHFVCRPAHAEGKISVLLL